MANLAGDQLNLEPDGKHNRLATRDEGWLPQALRVQRDLAPVCLVTGLLVSEVYPPGSWCQRSPRHVPVDLPPAPLDVR